MTNQSFTIALCVLLVVGVPVGTFVAIKTIHKLCRAPENILIRNHGDIELTNFIEPVRPEASYNIDILNYNRYSNFNGTRILPSYRSGTIPEYQTIDNYSYNTSDRFYINSILENEYININFIIILISILLILYFLWKIMINKIIQFINILNQYFLGSQTSKIKKSEKLNLFSSFEIDFRDSFEWELKLSLDKPRISYLKIQTLTQDIIKLLNSLKPDVNYSMSLAYISSYEQWTSEKEIVDPLFIDNAIIINKDSDPILITQFIMHMLDVKCYFITNWLNKDSIINSKDPVIISGIVPIEIKI